MYDSLEEAQARIAELEKENFLVSWENKRLKRELDKYKSRKVSGRKKHDEKWTAAYNECAAQFDAGISVAEVAKKSTLSRRTVYRYKAAYDQAHAVSSEESTEAKSGK